MEIPHRATVVGPQRYKTTTFLAALLEISKFCYYFMIIQHNGEIDGKVANIRPRRSPIPAGGQEIKFTAAGPIADKMKQLLRDNYTWDYTGEQIGPAQNEDDEDDLEL